jgi:hypothetical protein
MAPAEHAVEMRDIAEARGEGDIGDRQMATARISQQHHIHRQVLSHKLLAERREPETTVSPSGTVTEVLTRRCWMVGEATPELVVGVAVETSCSI